MMRPSHSPVCWPCLRVLLAGLVLILASPLIFWPARVHADVVIGSCTVVSNPTSTHFTNCPNANLSNKDLSGVVDLSFANFSGANLTGANVADLIVDDVNFNNANLTNADLSGDSLNRANFTNANLTGTNLDNADLSAANLSSVIWNNTKCPDATNSNSHGNTCLGHLLLPSITATATQANGASYTPGAWTNQNVTVHFICTAATGHKIETCPADQTYTTEGSFSANGTAIDTDGFFSEISFGPLRIDKTKPTISGSRTPAANSNGWNDSDVTINFACADNQNGAGLATNTVAAITVSNEGANQMVTNTGVCVDNAGNAADPVTIGPINIDKSAPETIITRQPDNPSPLVATFEFSGADPRSGVIGFVCSLDGAPATPCVSPQHYDPLTGGAHTFGVQAVDAAGNVDPTAASYTWTASGDLPVANDQSVTTAEEQIIVITLQGSGKNTLTYTIVDHPAHGALSALSGSPPTLTYTPTLNFNGSDSFTFRVNDGQLDSNLAKVTINVTPVNDPPVINQTAVTVTEDTPLSITLNVQEVDGDPLTYSMLRHPLHGALRGALPAVTYTPALNFNGSDSFVFSVSDGAPLVGGASPSESSHLASVLTGTVEISVIAVNDAPVAANQIVATLPNTPMVVTLHAIDAEGDPLTYTLVETPQHGALSGTAPNLTYTPAVNFNGNDSLIFQVSDGHVTSAIATIVIRVTDQPFGLFLPLVRR